MHCKALLLALGLAVVAGPATGRGDRLPAPVREALAAAAVPEDAYAAVVVTPEGRSLLAHRASEPMNPASVMKLVTTWAGLDLLGPAHVWRTEVLARGVVEDGHLRGDLVLRGDGDPALTLEALWLLLRDVRARGIAHVDGDIVLDRSAFAIPEEDPGRFDGEPLRPYNAGPDALLLNHRSVRLTFVPDAASGTVRILAEPPLPEVTLVSEMVLGDGPCEAWPEKPEADLAAVRLTFRGTYPLACGEKVKHFMPLPPGDYARSLLRQVWESLGGRIGGGIRDGTTPADAWTVTRRESPPLADVVRDINKNSNNVMARQLFLTLGRRNGGPGTPEAARSEVTAWLAGQGLPAPELVLENGAGLSRIERISADTLARLLRLAWMSPLGPEFVASLPLAGIDGTLKRWFQDSPAAGRAHLKTGYLEEVRAMAGIVHGPEGRVALVVGMVNHRNARGAAPAQEALVKWALEALESPRCCTGMRHADPQGPRGRKGAR